MMNHEPRTTNPRTKSHEAAPTPKTSQIQIQMQDSTGDLAKRQKQPRRAGPKQGQGRANGRDGGWGCGCHECNVMLMYGAGAVRDGTRPSTRTLLFNVRSRYARRLRLC